MKEFKIWRTEYYGRSHNKWGGATSPSELTVTVGVPPGTTEKEEDEIVDYLQENEDFRSSDYIDFKFEIDEDLRKLDKN